jgi:hypothetical protein
MMRMGFRGLRSGRFPPCFAAIARRWAPWNSTRWRIVAETGSVAGWNDQASMGPRVVREDQLFVLTRRAYKLPAKEAIDCGD